MLIVKIHRIGSKRYVKYKKTKSQKKDQMVTIKCTSQQKKQLMQRAQQKDISVSEYVLEGAVTSKECQCRKNKIDMQCIRMGRNVNTLWKFADQCAQCYFDAGYQVVYAIHGTNESNLHIHFAVSTINFRSGLKWHDSKTDLDLREALFNKILGKYQYMFIINK